MKRTNIFITLLFVLSITYCKAQEHLQLKVIKEDYSTGFTIFYLIRNDSLLIETNSGDSGDMGKTRVARKLSSDEISMVDSIPFQKYVLMKREYNNRFVMDGLRMVFELKKNGKDKVIQVGNTYVPEIYDLIEVFNKVLVKDKCKIHYYGKGGTGEN